MKQNKEQNNMKVVGITGGVGSGKSVVMNILKEKYGAEVILADLVAHDLMEPGQQNYLDILSKFPQQHLRMLLFRRQALYRIRAPIRKVLSCPGIKF